MAATRELAGVEPRLRQHLITELERAGLPALAADAVDLPWDDRAAALRAARRFYARLGWTLVVEQVLGPDRAPSADAELVTPRLAPGERRVLHAEAAGLRWEVGALERAHDRARGALWHPQSTVLRLAEAGAWPGWLAPVQVEVAPVGREQAAAAAAMCAELDAAGLRAALRPDGTVGRRVREAARRGVPGVVVLGADELARDRVALRWRGARLGLERGALIPWLQRAIDSAAPRAGHLHPEAAQAGAPHPRDGSTPSPNPLQEN
ncbi:MAG: His/Gly/Thr/Pro-type tRNA ligase C-terminal domain-containing protein [Planctomycetota bacterium]